MSDTSHGNPPTANQAELYALFLKLAHNKKTRPAIAKAIKEVAPESVHAQAFGDVDADDKFEAFRKEQEQKELERQKAELIRDMNIRRSALLTGGPDGQGRKYSEDDVKKIESLMEKKGIVDYEDGATIFAATLPPPEPKPGETPLVHGSRWEFPEFEKYAKDPNKAANEAATQLISDFMRKR